MIDNQEASVEEQAKPESNSFSQYSPSSSGPFVEICKCLIYEKLEAEERPLRIKEATTGYLDPQTGQETGSFVTYVIEFGETLSKCRRRYSDFELLAAHLNRVYPHQVIPPIPEKESITSIISGYTGLKGRHDPFLIQHRTRLFQSFLANICLNPTLLGDHYFHRFVDADLIGPAWSEGITAVPGKLDTGFDGLGEGSEAASNTSPNLYSSSAKGRVPDPLVIRLEDMTKRYREGIKSIEKGQSKLLKRLKDESSILGELGASFNAFSLELDSSLWANLNCPNDPEGFISTNQISSQPTNQRPSFKHQLEMIGQSSDSEVVHLHALIRHHEFLRDRLQEMILYCGCILRALTNLNLKRASLEDFHDQINSRKNILMQMESNVRADSDVEGKEAENLRKLRKYIDELESSKKTKLGEMNDFSTALIKDVDRTFAYFGETWRESLKALAKCQSTWHEEAIKSWQKG